MTRRTPRLAVFAATVAVALTLAACGSEDDATGGPSSSEVASSTTSHTAAAESSGSSSTTSNSAQLRTENPSAPIVGGPVPASKRSSHKADPDAATRTTTSAPTPATGECGTTQGPDGALHIVILAGEVTCAEAKGLTKEYNAKAIATGQQKKVGDWTCGPSQVHGLLAACQKDQSVIGFTP
ncbi:hypothetical protein GII33_21150 [Gordonia pseudamarae]|jgi:hypothetical protein|uniref:Secreted protein n=1 Tax=Gordonia pseudamarae TaxID=2831662 RepID=A0ABX6IM39_9ACTN|nr:MULTISPECIES: hypothetical protein [Gordonia]MBD0023802.1 hypothetical protein [Gordonia sp. (in: high G+C Gram-positive bacteria)]QHN28107.1 hypothetical protein GII33_21150 [Gordonia pseudamarae]QHN36969.1 hypothetical protein GII31_20785 [Gordonia pseudamarae]